jgi:DNA polymerase-3 subunit gamma/tau
LGGVLSSYQVIARKYRSQNFSELIGQNHISQTLLNALRANRTPQAILLTGPRGTGKTSTARIFAKSLRCPDAKDFIPCGKCSECEDIAQGRAVDVIEIDGASNNGVDAIRELRETVGYMPARGGYKIYIIDEVHMLSGSAFNALLKTLEEPPPHVVFVMATTEVQKIPNTILSRCQRFDFRRIPARLIAEHLAHICKSESVKAESEALWIIARQGDGSMRDSQSLLEQVISFTDSQITTEKVTEVLGLTDRALLLETLKALIDRDTKAGLTVIEKLFEAGYDPAIFLKDLLEELRNLLLIKVSGDKTSFVVDLPEEEIKYLSGLTSALTEEDIHLIFDMTLKGANDLAKAQDTRVLLEMLILRMTAAPRIQVLKNFSGGSRTMPSVEAKKSMANATSNSTNEPRPTPTKALNEPTKTITTSDSTGRWLELIERIKGVNGMLGAKLDHLQLVDLTKDKLTLSLPAKYKFLSSQIADPQFQKKLKNYMNTFWGSAVEVQINETNDASQGLSAKQVTEINEKAKDAALKNEVDSHPLVKSVKDLFNTEIASIREYEGK